jgi:MoaD family protein
MSVTVQIPTPLRRFTGDAGEVAVEGDTVEAALADLVRRHPQLERHLFGDDGRVRSFVNVFVNDDNVRFADGGATRLGEGDTVSIIPSIAGGAGR